MRLATRFLCRAALVVAAFGLCILTGSVVATNPEPVSLSTASQQQPEPPRSGETKPPFVPTEQYATRMVEGWTVRVNKKLLAEESNLGKKALRLLSVKLFDIERMVPRAAVAKLRRVPIWLGINDGHAPCAEYHPNREWLVQNGYNPDKAKGVELGNARRFLDWSRSQPSMVLHELAHAYHDQVLGFDHPGVKQAYEKAKASGTYASVLRANGKRDRAYALTNPQEYFAEATEAYFGTNDFYPFVRAELQLHDPEITRVLAEVWSGK